MMLGTFELCHFFVVRERGEISRAIIFGGESVEETATDICLEDGQDGGAVEWGAEATGEDAEDGGFCLGFCDLIVVLEGDVGFSNDLI